MRIVSLIFLFQFNCFIAYNISLSYCCIIWFSDAEGCKSSFCLTGTRLLRIKCDVRKPRKGRFSSNQDNGKSINLILQCYLLFGICEVDALILFLSLFQWTQQRSLRLHKKKYQAQKLIKRHILQPFNLKYH